jgi:hypothetical protein
MGIRWRIGGVLRLLLLCFGCVAAIVPIGCGGPSAAAGGEVADGNFIAATHHIRAGNYDDAIRCLLAVIGGHAAAPESHLLLGTIYLDNKHDPISAIYFLRKYVELCGDNGQSKVAEQMIDAAKREFLKEIPPFSGAITDEMELINALRALKNQNAALRREIVSDRQRIAAYETQLGSLERRVVAAAAETKPEIHTVEEGETLSSISAKFYGNAAGWRRILEANGDTLRAPKDLKPGQRLTIPLP